jgi:hypothetical protein
MSLLYMRVRSRKVVVKQEEVVVVAVVVPKYHARHAEQERVLNFV